MDKVILTDCDGVLLDWETHFEKWMNEKGYHKIPDYDLKVYNLNIHYGIPGKEIRQLIADFNHSSAIGFCPAFRDAEVVVPKLHDKGYRFVVITSLTTNEYSARLRDMNLTNVFGPNMFNEVICLEVGADKDAELKKWVGVGKYWIEDKYENAMAGKRLGFETFLMEHDHNTHRVSDDDGLVMVKDWYDIYDRLT